ncbi:MAG: Nif3-like dinuclear metal center hexameric protein [Actinomycetota bacterium]|nr:Nif3-like dinuclear metal center hexameric protein [Actinomycetota bacterium]
MSSVSSQGFSLSEVVDAIERLYPPSTAESWDRVGLVTGDLDQRVRRVHLAVDPTLAVVREAVDAGADLLLTHHPLLLRGIHSVATATAKGETVTRAVLGDLAIYCAHTSADLATPGVCDALASACGIASPAPLTPLTPERPLALGRVGDLAGPMTLRAFVERLAGALPATAGGLRVSGDPEATVRRVAVVGGSGDDRFEQVRASGADVFVTADLRHHPVLEEREQTRGGRPFLVDAGHWATEWVWLAVAERGLRAALGIEAADDAESSRLETHVSTLRTEPWTFVVAANAASAPSALGPVSTPTP